MQNLWIFNGNWFLCIDMSRVKDKICLWMQNFAFWKTWPQSKYFWGMGHVLRNAKFLISETDFVFYVATSGVFRAFFVKKLSILGLYQCEINTIDQLICFINSMKYDKRKRLKFCLHFRSTTAHPNYKTEWLVKFLSQKGDGRT